MASYTVKQGDSLLDLAEKFNVSASTLLAANAGVSSIQPGVTLRIPPTALQTTPALSDEKRRGIPGAAGLPPIVPPKLPAEKRRGIPGAAGLPPAPVPPKLPAEKRRGIPGAAALPPITQPTYIPPAQSMAQLEARRVPQQPVVGLTGAQRPRPWWENILVQPDTPQSKVVGYLNRLFNRQPGVFRQQPDRPVVGLTGAQRPNYYQQFLKSTPSDLAGYEALGKGLTQHAGQASRAIDRFFGTTPGPAAPAARGDFYAETVRIANQLGISVEELKLAKQSGLLPSVGTVGAQGFPEFTEGERPKRSSILEWYLDRGRLPTILFAEDVARMGWTAAELTAAGYIQDQYGDWIAGGMTPGETAVATASGGGAGYYYPRGGGGGGGGGAYTYPSYLQRAATQYPQSFVQRGQKGSTPTGRSMRPARMGGVTWRI